MENEVVAVVNFMALDLPHLVPENIDVTGDEFKELLRHTYEDNLVFIQNFARVIDTYEIERSFCFVTKNATDYWGGEIDLLQGVVNGINKSYWREFTDTRVFEVDHHETATTAEVSEHLYTEVVSSINRYDVTREIVYGRDNKRYENKIKKIVEPSVNYTGEGSLDFSGTILITGGLGGVGFDVAKYLVTKPNLKAVVLTGRRPETDEKVAAKLNELRSLSKHVNVIYAIANVNAEEEMKKLIDDIQASENPLTGIIHTAGTNDDGLIFNQSYERFMKLVPGKVEGPLIITKLTKDIPSIKFTILLSSMSGFFGNRGQINYTTTNVFTNKVARYFRAHGRNDIVALQLAAWPSGLSSIIQDPTFHLNEINSINLVSNFASAAGDIPASAFGGPVLKWNDVRDHAICDPMYRPVRPANRPRLNWKTDNDSAYVPQNVSSNSLANMNRDSSLNSIGGGGDKSSSQGITEDNIYDIMEGELKKILQYSPEDEIDPYQSLTELGIDSIMMMELRTILRTATGVNIPLVVFSTQNICLSRLVDYVKAKLAKDKEEAAKKTPEITEAEKKAKEAEEQKAREEEAKLISNDEIDQWIVPVPGCEEVEEPSNVFIFFPSADEGEIDYSEYVEKMEDSLLFTVNLPGYGVRKDEPLINDWDLLVKNITKAIIQTDISGKFKECKTIHFIGNSFGAIVAWKTLLQIQIYEDEDKEVPIISTLVISRAIAPNAKRPVELGGEILSQLPNEGIAAFLKGTESKVDFSGEKAYLLPIIHNEYVMNDSVTNESDMKIRSKLLMFSGKQDKIIDDNNTSLWKKEVSDEFSEFTQHIKMRGNHWFVMKDTSKYLKNIMENLD